jgi:hypothetical protein
LFLKFEVTLVYKIKCTYVVIDALFRLQNTTEPIGIPNQTTNVALFQLQTVWVKEVKDYLQIGHMPKIPTNIQK